MNTSFIILLIMQLILLCFSACIMYMLLINKYSLDFDKRFGEYTISYNKNTETPYFEKMYKKIWIIIKKISKILSKSKVLNDYGNRYNKYLSNDDENKKTGMDYVSIKLILSIFLVLIYIVSSILRNNFNILFLLLIFIGSFFLLDIYYIINYKKRRRLIENDLLNAIIIMNNAFKSGMNIMQAISIVESELTGPIKDEFRKINIDIKYGLSLETVFDRFYNRVKIEDIKYISSSLSLINKTGGNIVRVFSAIEKNFYDKKKIRDEMNSLTSSSTFMFRLLVFMPILLVLIILVLNKDYFLPLINTNIGRVIILLILILYTMYIIVVKKVMKVNV